MSDGRRNDGDELDRRIADAKRAGRSGVTNSQARAEGRGWAIGIEFVGTILVCGLIGWGIDHYAGLHTGPFGMIVLLLLGFAAGTRRAMKTSNQFDGNSSNDTTR